MSLEAGLKGVGGIAQQQRRPNNLSAQQTLAPFEHLQNTFSSLAYSSLALQ